MRTFVELSRFLRYRNHSFNLNCTILFHSTLIIMAKLDWFLYRTPRHWNLAILQSPKYYCNRMQLSKTREKNDIKIIKFAFFQMLIYFLQIITCLNVFECSILNTK